MIYPRYAIVRLPPPELCTLNVYLQTTHRLCHHCLASHFSNPNWHSHVHHLIYTVCCCLSYLLQTEKVFTDRRSCKANQAVSVLVATCPSPLCTCRFFVSLAVSHSITIVTSHRQTRLCSDQPSRPTLLFSSHWRVDLKWPDAVRTDDVHPCMFR